MLLLMLQAAVWCSNGWGNRCWCNSVSTNHSSPTDPDDTRNTRLLFLLRLVNAPQGMASTDMGLKVWTALLQRCSAAGKERPTSSHLPLPTFWCWTY